MMSTMGALGAAIDLGVGYGLGALAFGLCMAFVASVISKRSSAKEQRRRDDLFANIGALLERRSTKVRVDAGNDEHPQELVDDEALFREHEA